MRDNKSAKLSDIEVISIDKDAKWFDREEMRSDTREMRSYTKEMWGNQEKRRISPRLTVICVFGAMGMRWLECKEFLPSDNGI